MARKGVGWNTGRVFLRDEQLYSFDLLGEAGHQRPAFVNLQQYYVEGYLLDRARALPNLEIRWKNRVAGVAQDADGVTLQVDTPDGEYAYGCDYLVAADGSRSPVRRLLGHESHGQTFRDRFLIADVRMQARVPGRALVLVRPAVPPQPVRAAAPPARRRVAHRLPARLGRRPGGRAAAGAGDPPRAGPARPRTRSSSWNGSASTRSAACAWPRSATAGCCSPATARTACRRSARAAPTRACRTRTTWPGSSAWCWRGTAPDRLLDSYCHGAGVRGRREHPQLHPQHRLHHAQDARSAGLSATRAAAGAGLRLRAAAGEQRAAVHAATLADSPLNTPDDGGVRRRRCVPGAPCTDAPVRAGRAARTGCCAGWGRGSRCCTSPGSGGSGGRRRRLACRAGPGAGAAHRPGRAGVGAAARRGADGDACWWRTAPLSHRFDARPGTTYLMRPDQHVCARWRRLDRRPGPGGAGAGHRMLNLEPNIADARRLLRGADRGAPGL